MGRLIDIAWPQLNVKVVAELNDERNPELCEEFWQQLPFKVTQAHPVVSGASMYAWTPVVSSAPVHYRELITECPIGRLRYSQSTGNKMSVQYGKGQEPLAQPVLGQVLPEYCHLLPGVGKAVWNNLFYEKDVIFLEVSAHEGQGHSGKPAKPINLAPLAQKLYDEAERIQLVEPEEIRALRLGEVEDAGTYGQYFSAWDFANGMLRDYIMYTIYPILTLAGKLEPKALSQVLNELDVPYSSYLSVVGFKKLEALAGEVREYVAKAESKEEIQQVLRAFLQYGNRLCAWSYQMFPWYLGMFYNRSKDGQERPGRWKPDAE
ncbi:DUF3830 domain-containing protein [Paraburkholderia sp. USG1]|uniref:cucumopine synthase-related protein n=1 Tax=Paraburkholderia sp. USG1 TaxID=2952268 RepID=UPI0028624680|nr:DUF3830 domain-containing protein [Paraburkholderia sp. USG1]MDR8395077.1 DUF3830 domain-containing protein [Paraburkholderia sp. USG1]